MLKKVADKLFRRRQKKTEPSEDLQKQIGHVFRDRGLLETALTHRSIEPDPKKNYERLEFLGDAVLDYVISDRLMRKFPAEDEGFLTQRRSSLVQKSFLAKAGNRLHLHRFLRVSSSVDLRIPSVRENQLANGFEAVLGAVFQDGGMKPAEKLIEALVWNHREEAWQETNFKGVLIEYCHSNSLESPRFVVTRASGPHHRRVFDVAVRIKEKTYGTGRAENRKAAEQEAAQRAYQALTSA